MNALVSPVFDSRGVFQSTVAEPGPKYRGQGPSRVTTRWDGSSVRESTGPSSAVVMWAWQSSGDAVAVQPPNKTLAAWGLAPREDDLADESSNLSRPTRQGSTVGDAGASLAPSLIRLRRQKKQLAGSIPAPVSDRPRARDGPSPSTRLSAESRTMSKTTAGAMTDGLLEFVPSFRPRLQLIVTTCQYLHDTTGTCSPRWDLQPVRFRLGSFR